MKKNLLKSLCLAFLLGGTAITANAQGIVVNKTDGTKVYYKASEVQSVGVYGYGEGPGEDPDAHEYVDLGLPSGTLWATCNIGAEKPEEYGDYFAWGETSGFKDGKTDFSWSTYRYYNSDGVTKYCTDSGSWYYDNKTELEMGDDAATVNWGVNWQMPSIEQFAELIDSNNTTTSWTTLNGVSGRMIVSKSNDKRIFLPAAGYRASTEGLLDSRYGFYWSRSLNMVDWTSSTYGRYLRFSSSEIEANPYNYGGSDYYYRYSGLCVRPVRVQE